MVETARPAPQETIEQTKPDLPAFLSRVKETSDQRFARQETIFTDPEEEFGVIYLRIEPGSHPRLSTVELATFIESCLDYALLEGQINELKRRQGDQEKIIKGTVGKHEGLVGIESEKLDITVGYEPSVSLKPSPVELRRQTGEIFPTIAKEELAAVITIPEKLQTRAGGPMTAEIIRNFVSLALEYAGIDAERQKQTVKWEHKAVVHESKGREKLYELAREGKVSIEILGATETKKMQVRPLSEKPKKTTPRRSGSTTQK